MLIRLKRNKLNIFLSFLGFLIFFNEQEKEKEKNKF